MSAYEIRGTGPDLVMLPGWGMHAGVWSDWADCLARDFRVHLLELPGHGDNDYRLGARLDDWSEALAASVPEQAWWLGWSLGALVALNAARLYPGRARGLVLVAGTPRFVNAPDWPWAVGAEVFDLFAAQLHQDVGRALLRFLSLQVRGAEGDGTSLRRLRALLSARASPREAALRDGLQLLQQGDLRAALGELPMPLLWLFGERDTLVPAAAAARVPGRRRIIAGAGHAPFLSHPQVCAAHIREWLGNPLDQVRHASV